jgi:hypothetical protein
MNQSYLFTNPGYMTQISERYDTDQKKEDCNKKSNDKQYILTKINCSAVGDHNNFLLL